MTKTQTAAAPKTAAKPVKADIVTLRHLATEVGGIAWLISEASE